MIFSEDSEDKWHAAEDLQTWLYIWLCRGLLALIVILALLGHFLAAFIIGIWTIFYKFFPNFTGRGTNALLMPLIGLMLFMGDHGSGTTFRAEVLILILPLLPVLIFLAGGKTSIYMNLIYIAIWRRVTQKFRRPATP